MFIPVPLGDCRVAIGKASLEVTAKIEADKKALAEQSFQHLHNGATHNGLRPTAANVQEMRDMADRDVEHAMRTHPGQELLGRLAIYDRMLRYQEESQYDPCIALDAEAFELLGEHLPSKVTAE